VAVPDQEGGREGIIATPEVCRAHCLVLQLRGSVVRYNVLSPARRNAPVRRTRSGGHGRVPSGHRRTDPGLREAHPSDLRGGSTPENLYGFAGTSDRRPGTVPVPVQGTRRDANHLHTLADSGDQWEDVAVRFAGPAESRRFRG
jgi:hypothetical protein